MTEALVFKGNPDVITSSHFPVGARYYVKFFKIIKFNRIIYNAQLNEYYAGGSIDIQPGDSLFMCVDVVEDNGRIRRWLVTKDEIGYIGAQVLKWTKWHHDDTIELERLP